MSVLNRISSNISFNANIVWKSDIYWTVHQCDNWRIKKQLDATYHFIVLLTGSTCFGHYYAHHQELATMMLITTLVVSFLVCCMLEVRCGWSGVVSGLQPGHYPSFGLNGCHLNWPRRNFAKCSANRNVCLLVINEKWNAVIIYSITTGPAVCLNEPIRNKQDIVTKVWFRRMNVLTARKTSSSKCR